MNRHVGPAPSAHDGPARVTANRGALMGDTTFAGAMGAWDPTLLLGGRRLRMITSVRMAWKARDYAAVITNETNRSPWGLVLLALLLRLRRAQILVLTEFLPGRREGLLGFAYRHTLPHACGAVQVLTAAERDDYQAWYGLHPSQLRLVPYYGFDDGPCAPTVPTPLPERPRSGYVMATGRNSCDWETVAAATHLVDHPFVLVSPVQESRRLAPASARSHLFSDLPRNTHDRLVGEADALLVVLHDIPRSMGHVRIMTAASRGVPVIASDVAGLVGYEHLVWRFVPPADPVALAAAITELVSRPDRARREADEIRRRARRRTRSQYLDEVRQMVWDVAARG